MSETASADYEFDMLGTRVAFHLPDAADHIQKHILRSGTFYEQEMLLEIGARIPDGALVVDAGANIGNHTLFFARMLGAKVLSFEPNPAALNILRRNIELNGLQDRVEIHAAALGAHAGKGEVVNVDAHNVGMAQIRADDAGSVDITSLDAVVAERFVHLVKIDVEGMESDVLSGATVLLERDAPYLIIEAATLAELERIETILRPRGYRKFKVFNHTPTYLFKKVIAAADDSAAAKLPAHIHAALPRTRSIHAGMATVAGNEVALRAAVSSLLPQVDHLHLYLNGFAMVPDFLATNPRVSCTIDGDGSTYGDAGKFHGLEGLEDAIYLTCDDDILYPDNYVEHMVAELASTGGRSIVCVHGALMLAPNDDYYGRASRIVFHFREPLIRNRRIHVAGTGTCAFHTETVRMALGDFRHPNMADIWLAEYAQARQIPVYAVSRGPNWLTPIEIRRPTIYEESQRGSGNHFDTSHRQNEVISAMRPLSVMRAGNKAASFILDIETGGDIPGILARINFNERDPVIFVICDTAGPALREAVMARGIRYELHFLARTQIPEEGYRVLLEQAARRDTKWTFGRDMRPVRLHIIDFDGWFNQTFAADG